MANGDGQARGRVVASFGRRALVQTSEGQLLSCVTRGRRSGIACGDWVWFARTSGDEGVIENVDARQCLLYRTDERHEKAIAANVTQVVVVLAVSPAPNLDFVDRCLVAAEDAGARTLILLNKTDLCQGEDESVRAADFYATLGYRTLRTSCLEPISVILEEMVGQLSVFIGQSGVGKSTLINRIVPGADARVGEISAANQAGRHTTTHARLYWLDAGAGLIDSPGMHAFGLSHIGAADLAGCFAEMRALLGQCRFSNCRHDGEPGCGIAAAAGDGRIAAHRYASYRRILKAAARS